MGRDPGAASGGSSLSAAASGTANRGYRGWLLDLERIGSRGGAFVGGCLRLGPRAVMERWWRSWVFHLWTASGLVSDSHDNVCCLKVHHTELSGNALLALGLDEYKPLTRALTTSSGSKVTALGNNKNHLKDLKRLLPWCSHNDGLALFPAPLKTKSNQVEPGV